jgi:hypothetical protein
MTNKNKRKKVKSKGLRAERVGSAVVGTEPMLAEPVLSAGGFGESTGEVSAERALRAVVMLVADREGKAGVVLADWVETVLGNMMAVGITTLRELVEGILTLNGRLEFAGRPKLHGRTVQALLMEAVDLVYWPESDVGRFETDSEEAGGE